MGFHHHEEFDLRKVSSDIGNNSMFAVWIIGGIVHIVRFSGIHMAIIGERKDCTE